jgi:putative transposase
MMVTESLAKEINVKQACAALTIPRSGFYRWKYRDEKRIGERNRPVSPLALSEGERQSVLDVLHSDRFVDRAPQEVYATLLDEGAYFCSVRTMYRILEEEDEVRERRNQLRHPSYAKPELIAEAPNQVWCWDITKLKGPVKWTYFYLYVILDIFSRYVVG